MRRAVLGVCLMVAAGCATDTAPAKSFLMLQQPDVGTMDAPLDAYISIEEDCVLLSNADGSVVERAFWPAGTVFDPDTQALTLPDGDVVTKGDHVVGSGGSEGTLADISDEVMGRVFVESTFSEFARTCRAAEVTAERIFTIGFIEAAD